jgi:hypothetical protein
MPRDPKLPMFTPARDAIIRRDWPRGVTVADIKADLDRLPGRETTALRIGVRAADLKVRRPPGFKPHGDFTPLPLPKPATAPIAAEVKPAAKQPAPPHRHQGRHPLPNWRGGTHHRHAAAAQRARNAEIEAARIHLGYKNAHRIMENRARKRSGQPLIEAVRPGQPA